MQLTKPRMKFLDAYSKEVLDNPESNDHRANLTVRLLRAFIRSQVALSNAFDLLLPLSLCIDGAKDFRHRIVPQHLRSSLVIYDIGGGARPCVTVEAKRRLGLRVIGIDIDKQEFAKAPEGIYDRTVVADIANYQEKQVADLVVCKSTLEHVPNAEAALAAMVGLLKPGGKLLVFTPCRDAMFARLNRLLPEGFKRRLLVLFMPGQAGHLGFPAFYDHCTPRDFRRFGTRQGLQCIALLPYYTSTYFSTIFPIHLLWRSWIIVSWLLIGENAAETFVLLASNPEGPV